MSIFARLYRIVSDIHSELWPESQTKTRTLADLRLPALPIYAEAILLLAGDIGSYRRRNVYRCITERYAERFLAVYGIPGNHYGYGGTDLNVCEAPALLPNYCSGATLQDGWITAATLWTDFQRGIPMVEEACPVGANDFRQIKRTTPARVKTRHREHLAFLEMDVQTGGIVMTHFAPSWQSISPNYGSIELNGYYASDLEVFILRKRPALWVYGHIHSKSAAPALTIAPRATMPRTLIRPTMRSSLVRRDSMSMTRPQIIEHRRRCASTP